MQAVEETASKADKALKALNAASEETASKADNKAKGKITPKAVKNSNDKTNGKDPKRKINERS